MDAPFSNFKHLFVDNFLSNVPEALSAFGITDFAETVREGATSMHIASWEWEHQVKLPEDLRNFFRTTNGYSYTWTGRTVLRAYPTLSGRIEVNALTSLVEANGFVRRTRPQFKPVGLAVRQMEVSTGSRVFVLNVVGNGSVVVLAYLERSADPMVLVCTRSKELFYLAKSFSVYMEMATYFMGIPEWEMMYTAEGAPGLTVLLLRALKPHILAYTNKSWIYQKSVEKFSKQKCSYRANYKAIFTKHSKSAAKKSNSSPSSLLQENDEANGKSKKFQDKKSGLILMFPLEYKLSSLPLFNTSISTHCDCPESSNSSRTASAENSDSDVSQRTSLTYPTSKRDKKGRLRRRSGKRENAAWLPFSGEEIWASGQ